MVKRGRLYATLSVRSGTPPGLYLLADISNGVVGSYLPEIVAKWRVIRGRNAGIRAGKPFAARQDLNPEADKVERNESLANLAAIWRKPSGPAAVKISPAR